MKILADATLPLLLHYFRTPFELTTYQGIEELKQLLPSTDILLCRSTLKVNESLLSGTKVKIVATASSGIDHIDERYLKKQNILLIDAKGSNARAVADYVIACLATLELNQPLSIKKAAVIGVGKVGGEVIERFLALGYDIVAYDPIKEQINNGHAYASLNEVFTCDLISIHANLHNKAPFPSKNLLNKSFFNALKNQTIIINAARGGIVDEAALLESNKELIYCTDVYHNEPNINKEIVDFSALCTPHIAGHAIEAKLSAIDDIYKKISKHLKLPQTIHPIKQGATSPLAQAATWQEVVLKHYSLQNETRQLKSAANKQNAFLTLRKAHNFRHHFNLIYKKDRSFNKILGV